MLWNEYYDGKAMVFDLCEIINAEFRDMAAAGCPLIQVRNRRIICAPAWPASSQASVIVERPEQQAFR
jgi:hypothetical protein